MNDKNEENAHRTRWRELSQNLTEREILYYVSGSPDGVREQAIKTFMKDVFKYSFHGSVETHLKALESKDLITKESPRRGTPLWHANHSEVMTLIQKELEEMKIREDELRDLLAYLKEIYAD